MTEYLNGYTLTAFGIAVLAFAWWLMRAKPTHDRPLVVEDGTPRKFSAYDLEQGLRMRAISKEEHEANALRDAPGMANYKPTPEDALRMRNTGSENNPPEPVQKYTKFPEPKPLKTIETREAKDGIPWVKVGNKTGRKW